MISILGYLFLVIFALTAALTIASLPGWITIPEWYRKKLFIALLLEVVGAVIILFNQSFIKPDTGTGQQPGEGTTVYVTKSFDAEKALSALRRDADTWYIKTDSASLGHISMTVEQEQLLADSFKTMYSVKKEYEVGNLKFYFMIDSISAYAPNTLYTYYIRFGERDASGIIKWQQYPTEFYKTPSGELNVSNGLKAIQDKAWQYSYYLALGVGQPSDNKVNFLNLVVLRSKIE